MSKTTTLKCDRCGKTWVDGEGSERLRKVEIRLGNHGAPADTPSAGWCRECVAETGVYRTGEEEKNPDLPTPLTLEEAIREIIRDEIDFTRE